MLVMSFLMLYFRCFYYDKDMKLYSRDNVLSRLSYQFNK